MADFGRYTNYKDNAGIFSIQDCTTVMSDNETGCRLVYIPEL